MRSLSDLVATAFSNAHANGYTFKDWDDRQIAEDMQAFDSNLEHYSIEDIEEVVSYLTPP